MSQAKIAALVTCHFDLGMGNSSTTGTGSSASQRDIMYGWMANPAYANNLWGEAFGYGSGGGGGGPFQGGGSWGPGWNTNPFEVTAGEPTYSGPGFPGNQGWDSPPFYGNNPNQPPSGPAVGPPPPGGGGFSGGGGGTTIGAGGPQVKSAGPVDMGSYGQSQGMRTQSSASGPPHVADPRGFWSDTQGPPNGRGFVGANHTYVQFGPDGYIQAILSNPSSSAINPSGTDGGTPRGVMGSSIPYNPYNPGSSASPQSAGGGMQMNTMSGRVPIAIGDGGGGRGDASGGGPPAAGGGGEGTGGGGGGGTTPTPGGVQRMPIIPATGKRPPTQTVGPRPVGGPWVPNPANPGGPGIIDPHTQGYQWGSGGASGNRTAAGSQLWTQFNQLADPNANLDPAYRAALTQEAMNATRAGYSDARAQLGRHVANTGNSAGYVSGMSELGRRESNAYGQQARQNVMSLEAERQRRRELGLQGLSGLYGGEGQYNLGILGALGNMMNSPISTRNVQRNVEGSNTGSFNLGINL